MVKFQLKKQIKEEQIRLKGSRGSKQNKSEINKVEKNKQQRKSVKLKGRVFFKD